MNNRKYMLALPLVAAVSIIIGLLLGRSLDRAGNGGEAKHKLNEILKIIGENYVDEVDFDSLIELSLPEILRNLDPHSAYIPKADREAVNRDLEGSFFGVGIQFQIINDTLHVMEVISGAAADNAGLMPGDRIIKVDGKNIAGNGTDNEKVFSLLRGPKDTHVKLQILRKNSAKPLDFDLVRGEVPTSPIDASYIIDGNVGYVRLGKFSENAFSEFLSTLVQLQYDGAKDFIIDLRGNGGGYMEPAVLIANEFLEPGQTIVSTKGRLAADHVTLYSDASNTFKNSRLIVLIDEYSASSSEILSGAIQDNDRGLIIGRRSFGKGLVQQPFELPDSSEFRLTVKRYYTPSGRCIQKTYHPGQNGDYDLEVYNRYSNGELFSADSIRIDKSLIFTTSTGRKVYGGGGIIPDVFVPSDTTGITSYYIKVANAGLLRNFAAEYAELNRTQLNEASTTRELLSMLPADNVLLHSFVNYAQTKGKVQPRWYYINNSAQLIVTQIKALIARDIMGLDAYFEINNESDPVVIEALKQLRSGKANFPIGAKAKKK